MSLSEMFGLYSYIIIRLPFVIFFSFIFVIILDFPLTYTYNIICPLDKKREYFLIAILKTFGIIK